MGDPQFDSQKAVSGVFALFHIEGKGNQRIIEQFFMDALGTIDNGTNKFSSIAEKPRSVNSQKLRKLLSKLDFCKELSELSRHSA